MSDALAKELAVFEQKKDSWIAQHLGEFVVLHGSEEGGFYKTYAEALRAGLARFGVEADFLIRQVLEEQPVHLVY